MNTRHTSNNEPNKTTTFYRATTTPGGPANSQSQNLPQQARPGSGILFRPHFKNSYWHIKWNDLLRVYEEQDPENGVPPTPDLTPYSRESLLRQAQ